LLLHHQQKDTAALETGEQGLRIFEELSDDVGQAYAWTEIAHAQAALQKLDEAVAAYEKALALRRALAQPHLEAEVLAGLIRVDLTRQQLDEANRKAQSLLAYLQNHQLLGVEEPGLTYWSCALALLDEEEAQKALNEGRRMVEERAAAIDDEEVRKFFLQIPSHHTIRQAWDALSTRRVYWPVANPIILR
jgi:flagellar biosynthesis regulator FlbT